MAEKSANGPEATIFYSWQSDLPNATNRGFIQRALEDAIKVLHIADVTAAISTSQVPLQREPADLPAT